MAYRDRMVKTFTIAQLPDGCEAKEYFGPLVIDPDIATVMAIASEGGIGDWAAYLGWPDISQIRPSEMTIDRMHYAGTLNTEEGILDSGDKLGADLARVLFPEWKDKRYRR